MVVSISQWMTNSQAIHDVQRNRVQGSQVPAIIAEAGTYEDIMPGNGVAPLTILAAFGPRMVQRIIWR